MRGLVTAGPVMRRGASSVLGAQRQMRSELVVEAKVLLAVIVPPALLSFGCVFVECDLLGLVCDEVTRIKR